ncbi:DUF6082 family protein [Mangrovihabitans endophyticus]|uniref:Uncharacterized protein n=1 Tax=Mangrovihabitans endophyticus TaxID=1751298 RepID=A0A8J3C3G2_9ACTN|nr:DUF6082 family protein [Mangrovihabitans endophyticus]GGL04454.1 hypothetical protein GCM10012284_43830 [Mangrovihabitans endophyticus]
MAAGELHGFAASDRKSGGARTLTALLIAAIACLAGAMAFPFVLTVLSADEDYSAVGNVGEGASALVAGLALIVVTLSVLVQYKHLQSSRAQSLDDFGDDLILIAMEHPHFRQCWGPRVSPEHIDEELFYYCSKVVKLWIRSWQLGRITEQQAREYLARFFDSEVPRRFWEQYGNWHLPPTGAHNHEERFHAIMDEEYLRAVKAGPPTRPYEMPASAKPRLASADTVDARKQLGACGAEPREGQRPIR